MTEDEKPVAQYLRVNVYHNPEEETPFGRDELREIYIQEMENG